MISIMFEEIVENLPGVRSFTVATGDSVFRQGEPAAAIFQVREGSVSMVRHLADGSLLTVATSGPGETFAEASLFSEDYHCDAIARAKSVVLSIPSATLRQKLASDPVLAVEYAKFLSQQVRELRARLEIQRIRRASERVMAWLMWRARGRPTFEVADAWTRIASELGLTPEALYRALKELESKGAIFRDGRQVRVF